MADLNEKLARIHELEVDLVLGQMEALKARQAMEPHSFIDEDGNRVVVDALTDAEGRYIDVNNIVKTLEVMLKRNSITAPANASVTKEMQARAASKTNFSELEKKMAANVIPIRPAA